MSIVKSSLDPAPQLGLRENAYQFFLLVVVNAFVGAMIGLERSILPELAEKEFFLAAKSAILSFIVVFGFTKALMNYFAGRLSDKYGRKHVLVAGWFFAIPVPFLLMWAPSWSWILIANVFLGISQGLTWSTTVIMKIDLVGPKQRGLAMGLNEFAGYFAVAVSALLTGLIASRYGVRPEPFYLGVLYVVLGLLISFFLVKETQHHVQVEINSGAASSGLNQKEIFLKTSFLDRNLSSVTQAGFVNNLNDGMAWGLFPILFASVGLGLKEIGWLAAIYPASWGILQLFTGHLSDKVGRKWLIVWGMWIQAIGIAITISFVNQNGFVAGFVVGALLLGAGTAMVYPTLLATIGDVAYPSWRASSVGIYRLWRDSGYAIGALVSGIIADSLGLSVAIWFVAFITFLSGVVTAVRQSETLQKDFPETLSVDDLQQIPRSNHLVLIDVRSPEEFEQGHIVGAINRPKESLPDSISEVPKSVRIITNCGKGGGRSTDAAKLLRQRGWLKTQWLEGGYRAYASSEAIKVYDEKATEYDQWFDRHEQEFQAEVQAIKQILPPDINGAEIGLGSGRFAEALGIKQGVEPAAKMKLLAERKGIAVQLGLAEHLPYANNSMDFLLYVNSLCFVADLQKSLAEAYRVLKPKGFLIIGFIDKESKLGIEYELKKYENPFYRYATFLSTNQYREHLINSGFDNFSFKQTIFDEPDLAKRLAIKEGHDKGGFVVLKCQPSMLLGN